MIILWIRLKLSLASKSQFLDVVRGVLEPTRALEGCVDSRLFEDLETPGCVSLVQLWTNRDSLARYLQDRRFITILKAIDISDESPEFLICEAGELQVLGSAQDLIGHFLNEESMGSKTKVRTTLKKASQDSPADPETDLGSVPTSTGGRRG